MASAAVSRRCPRSGASRRFNGLTQAVSIIGQPGEALHDQERVGALPGVAWADDPARSSAYDVVYR